MASRKRIAEAIDLTGDDGPTFHNPRTPKQPRTSYGAHPRSRSTPGSSQADPLFIDDDEDGSQEVADSTQAYNDIQYGYVYYGTISTKIVGCRYYNGYATVGEMAIARREPRNQYDSNAIQVLNVQGAQIGHIPRVIAARLAKYMDNRSLLVETVISGEKGYYDCPIDVKLYGTGVPADRHRLESQMLADHLPVPRLEQERREREARQREMERRERERERRERERQRASAKAFAKAARQQAARERASASQAQFYGDSDEDSMSQYIRGSSQGMEPGPSWEEILENSRRFNPRNVEQVIEEFGTKEEDLAAMPKAAQPVALKTQLHPFQLQGLQWMLEKERPQLPPPRTLEIVQLWKRHASVPNAFTNVATNFSTKEPTLASGGILADDMGLGKTIQIISLIMADRASSKSASGVCDATLILAPVSVMSNWSTQIAKHIKEEHALRVMFYHGMRKQPITPKSIKDYDVVISTYDSVSTEWHSQKSTTLPRKSGVFSVTWRRVILDEGHNIRNPKAKRTIAASNLMAQSRWALTGTPIINNLKDLYSLVRFLRLSGGLDNLEIFYSAIIRPVATGSTQGNRSLQLLMKSICLRRKKEMSFIDLRLPDLEEFISPVTLFPHEQEKYDALEAQAQGTLDAYRNSMAGQKSATDAYRHLLEVLLRMRQLCNHWKLVGEERLNTVMQKLEAEGAVDLTPENKVALQQMLQLSIESQDECPVCMETLNDPVITKCAHIFCTACIERVIDMQHRCPMCRTELESLATTTVKPAAETSNAIPLTQEQLMDKQSLEKETSSKVKTLIDILRASASDPTNKTIIFSQWTSFLDLIQPHLTVAGFKYTRIDGSMTAPQRDLALEALDSDPETTVMLASLSVCSVGLNLVAANHVIMADSWWAPAIEDQAVDRVHRLGQMRKTKVFRLVVEGSIEHRVLGIQDEKRKLMGLAFAEKERRGKKRPGAGLADLERLLGGSGGRVAEANGGAGRSRN